MRNKDKSSKHKSVEAGKAPQAVKGIQENTDVTFVLLNSCRQGLIFGSEDKNAHWMLPYC